MRKNLITLAIASILAGSLLACVKSPLQEQCDKVRENSAKIITLIDRASLEHRALNTPESAANLAKVIDLSNESIKQLKFCQKELAK